MRVGRGSRASLLVHLCGVAVLVSTSTQAISAKNQPIIDWEKSRVRSSSATVRLLMQDAAERSATFRSLVVRTNATNGLVYIDEAKCPGTANACLYHWLQRSGPNRVLHIGVTVARRAPIR